MQKQKKNLDFKKKKTHSIKNWSTKEALHNKSKIRIRRIFKNKLHNLNPTFRQLFAFKKDGNLPSKKLSIRITPNNIFCTLKNMSKKKTIYVGSSGMYKIKTSRKMLRYSTKVVIGYFLKAIKKELNSKKIVVNLIGPIRTRKTIIKQLTKYFKKSSLILNVENKKCFNGCRPKKKKRKKQKGLRVFK